MFLTDSCVTRILHKKHPENTISAMGLMDLNNAVELLFDKILQNCTPLIQINEKEVILSLDFVVPDSIRSDVKNYADKELEDFKKVGKQIGKRSDSEFPLDELQSRMRENYRTVTITAEATVYTAAVLEYCIELLLDVAANKVGKNRAIGRNDVKWALANDMDVSSVYQR